MADRRASAVPPSTVHRDVAEYERVLWSARKIGVRLIAGASMNFDAGTYVALVSADGDLEVSSENGQFVPLAIRRGFKGPGNRPMGKVTVRNATVSTVTGVIITGNGEYVDFQAYTSTSPLAVTLAHDPLPVLAKGTEAAGAALASNPVPVGGSSADGKVRVVRTDSEGRAIAVEAAPADLARGSAHFVANTIADVIAAPGAGKQLIVGTVTIANDGAGPDVAILYDDATEILRLAVAAGVSYVIPCGPGMAIAVNKALRANVVTGGDSMRVFANARIVTP